MKAKIAELMDLYKAKVNGITDRLKELKIVSERLKRGFILGCTEEKEKEVRRGRIRVERSTLSARRAAYTQTLQDLAELLKHA